MIDGSIHIVFERRIDPPFRPATGTVFKAYDPTYYIAHAITQEPILENATGCSAQLIPFEPTLAAAAEQDALAKLGVNENPLNMQIGEIFSDRIELSCD